MASFFDDLPESDAGRGGAFTINPIVRWSETRAEDAVETALNNPAARLMLFRDGNALVRNADALFALEDARALGANFADAVLLGWQGPAPRLATTVGGEAPLPDGIAASTIRMLAMESALPAEQLGALAHAQGLLNWHGRHRFCSNCGAATHMTRGGYRRDCPSCGTQHFPRTDPVVIMLAIDGDNVVLGRKAQFPPGSYSCLAGFVEPGETIEDAVRRETKEESGVDVGRVKYFASQPWPFPTTLMIGAHAEALSREITRDEEELEDCRWFTREEVRAMLARAHPDKLMTPPPMTIAHQIIAAWAKT